LQTHFWCGIVVNMSNHRRAFTLVELMVTVSIIALLIGLLVPALGSMRRAGWATKSQSNLRQWGMAMDSWASIHDDTLPWEGSKVAADMGTNLAKPNFWPNALAGMLGVDSYATISERAFQEQRNVDNWDGAETVWNDPGAVVTRSEPWSFGDAGKGGLRRQFWFNYGMNYRLNQTLLQQAGVPGINSSDGSNRAHCVRGPHHLYV
jgi:prepilin-type N-terminal cleavage/methylation domain-containing protein